MRIFSCLLLSLVVVALFVTGCDNIADTADKEAPAVTITKPATGDTVWSPSVTLIAEATDDFDVTKVDFYVDGQLQGSVTSTPYRMTITPTSFVDGAHTAQAKAYDAAGNVGASAVVVFVKGSRADTQAPVVSLTKPAPGDTVGTVSVELVATATDDIEVTKVEFYIDGQMQTTVTSAPYQATVTLSSFADGPHNAQAKAFDEVGNMGVSAVVPFVKGNSSANVVNRYVLAEITTSANCTSCAPQNEAFRTAVENNATYKERVITVKYHGWFPRPTDSIWLATQSWAKPRIDYLFGALPLSFPKAWIDGTIAGSTATAWVQMLQNQIAVAPEAKIEVTKTDNGGSLALQIKVTGLTATAYSDLQLHTVVTEDEIYYNDGNAEFEHWDVMCEMLPTADGESITMSNGQTKSYSRQITIKNGWHQDKLNAVVFVQSKGSKKILQAAKISLK
jgi:hypothetical protein